MEDEARGARYSDLFEGRHDHGADCAYCPICATIAVVRKTRPEVLEHLAAAARELVVVAGILLEEAGSVVGAEKPAQAEKETKVRHIDIA